jgi:hypothetical protein
MPQRAIRDSAHSGRADARDCSLVVVTEAEIYSARPSRADYRLDIPEVQSTS